MAERTRELLLVGGCVLALAACGGSGSPKTSSVPHPSSATPPGSATQGSSASTTRGISSTRGGSPAKLLSAAQLALRSSHGYEMQGTITKNGHTVAIAVTVDGAQSLKLSLSQGSGVAQMITTPTGSYLRANEAFWAPRLGARGQMLANRWFKVPPIEAGRLARGLGAFRPSTLARCLGEHHGTLSLAGRTTVDGVPAIQIRDAGNAPGTSPGLLAVAASGPPYPLRALETGSTRPGGPIDSCNAGGTGETRGSVTLSHFNHVPPVQAPRGALTIPSPAA
jgi:hypothetical protein